MMAVRDRLAGLHTPVTRYLPPFTVNNRFEERVPKIEDTWLQHRVGEKYSYSNLGINLAPSIPVGRFSRHRGRRCHHLACDCVEQALCFLGNQRGAWSAGSLNTIDKGPAR